MAVLLLSGCRIKYVTFSSKILSLLNCYHKSTHEFLQMAATGKKGKGTKKRWCRVFPVKYGRKGQYGVLFVCFKNYRIAVHFTKATISFLHPSSCLEEIARRAAVLEGDGFCLDPQRCLGEQLWAALGYPGSAGWPPEEQSPGVSPVTCASLQPIAAQATGER